MKIYVTISTNLYSISSFQHHPLILRYISALELKSMNLFLLHLSFNSLLPTAFNDSTDLLQEFSIKVVKFWLYTYPPTMLWNLFLFEKQVFFTASLNALRQPSKTNA